MTARPLRPLLALLLVAALASPAFAQRQTGAISGQILNKEGKPLPGATVSISGPALMGVSSYLTSDTGLFRFAALMPGDYELRAEMPGFKSYVFQTVLVVVGRTTEIIARLEEAPTEEEVTLTAASPVVDVKSSKFSVNYSARFLASLPMNRDLYDIQNSIPGAVGEGMDYRRTSSILGGTVRSQLYALDGMPLNDPATSSPLVNINVTISIGGAYAPEWIRSTTDLWTERADQQLYQAKSEGRNRVYIEEQPMIAVSAEEKSLLFGHLSFGDPAWIESAPSVVTGNAMQ